MKILLVVDVQKDFCEGGALAVKGGNAIVPVINKYIEAFLRDEEIPGQIVYTKDWHPKDHSSFKEQGGMWPPHCVQNTYGADLHHDLKIAGTIFHKGMLTEVEEFSALPTNDSPLANYIIGSKPDSIYVCGLATDYCVKQHVLDLLKLRKQMRLSFRVYICTDVIASVNITANDGRNAIHQMVEAGAMPIEYAMLDYIPEVA